MPIAILLIVGLVVYNSGVIDKVKNPNQGKVTEVVAPKTVETKIILQNDPKTGRRNTVGSSGRIGSIVCPIEDVM